MDDLLKNTENKKKNSSLNWQNALEQMEKGEVEAFYKNLYQTTVKVARKFYNQLLKLLTNDFYEDFTQDIFLKLYEKGKLNLWLDLKLTDETLNSEIESYIFTSLKNHIRDILKSKKYNSIVGSIEEIPESSHLFITHQANPEEELFKKIDEESNLILLKLLLARINDNQRFILFNYQKFGGDLKRPDLAFHLKLSIGAIQKNADKIRAIGLEIVTEYNREKYQFSKK